MTETSSVRAYWDATDRRDWQTFATLLADDVVYRVPQTGEQITGRDRYRKFNELYPGNWSIHLQRVVAGDAEAVSWIRFDVDGQRLTAVTFFRFGPDGRIAEIDDFWPEAYDAPPRPEGVMDA